MNYWTLILVKGLQRYQRSNLEFGKNICQLGWPWTHGFEPGWSADIFYELQIWPLVSLQSLDQNQCLVLHLKDLFHICLGTKAQSFWKTFNVCNLGSKYPYFNRAYVVSSGFWCLHLYHILLTDHLSCKKWKIYFSDMKKTQDFGSIKNIFKNRWNKV